MSSVAGGKKRINSAAAAMRAAAECDFTTRSMSTAKVRRQRHLSQTKLLTWRFDFSEKWPLKAHGSRYWNESVFKPVAAEPSLEYLNYISPNHAGKSGTNRTTQAEISNLPRHSFPGRVNQA